MIRITGQASAVNRISQMKAALAPSEIDHVVDRVALETFAELVKATPKRWFGQVRAAWRVMKPEEGVRIVRNESKIMVFLEHGTANAGTGYIYPKTKKALYIPLTRRASSGWREGLVYGTDYVLAKRARGIKPRNIAGQERPRAEKRLRAAMATHIRRSLANG